jgi:hypothetical protein
MKKIFFSFFLICFRHCVIAQINDAQLWENITVEKNITQKISTRIVQQARFTENVSLPSFNYFDIGINYKINKHIHATLAYVWVEKRQLTDFWSTRHQAYACITFRKKINKFLLSDRQMFLWQVKDYYTSDFGYVPDYYLRNKFTIRYDKYFKVAPYLAEEIYYRTYGPDDPYQFHFNRLRCFAGIFYRPNLINEFEAYYLIEHHFNIADPVTNWIIGLGYTHTF